MLFNSLNTISKLPKRLGGAKQPNFLQVSSTITSTTYYSVGISDTGQYILALNGSGSAGFLYVSSNFGASFITISGQIPTNLCYPCAVSGTGQYMVMMISNGFMYRSENYGVNLGASNQYFDYTKLDLGRIIKKWTILFSERKYSNK